MRRIGGLALAMVVPLAGCSLIYHLSQTGVRQAEAEEAERRTAERQAAEAEAARQAAAERAQREAAILAELELRRTEALAEGAAPVAIAGFVRAVVGLAEPENAGTAAQVDLPALAREAAALASRELERAPEPGLFAALAALPRDPEVDPEVVRACARVRPTIAAEARVEFVGQCLARAGGDATRLTWPHVQDDLAAYQRAEEARRQAEAAAEAERARLLTYAVAAVFAAGRCHGGDCTHNGWSFRTPLGEVDVQCNFGNCLTDGWSARLPDGVAETRCNFNKCLEDGWDTRFPDGSQAATRCNFNKCLEDGWDTRLPSGEIARSRCNFNNCLVDGWDTEIPGGPSIRCRCAFGDCRENGADCS